MKKKLLVTDADRCRLGRLLASDDTRCTALWQRLDELEWHLETSEAASPESIPADVVTMNSTVRLANMSSSEQIVRTVVYPEDLDLVANGISVLTPLGTRLIGCEVGNMVECDDPKYCGRWRVAEIVFQPERVGKFEL